MKKYVVEVRRHGRLLVQRSYYADSDVMAELNGRDLCSDEIQKNPGAAVTFTPI